MRYWREALILLFMIFSFMLYLRKTNSFVPVAAGDAKPIEANRYESDIKARDADITLLKEKIIELVDEMDTLRAKKDNEIKQLEERYVRDNPIENGWLKSNYFAHSNRLVTTGMQAKDVREILGPSVGRSIDMWSRSADNNTNKVESTYMLAWDIENGAIERCCVHFIKIHNKEEYAGSPAGELSDEDCGWIAESISLKTRKITSEIAKKAGRSMRDLLVEAGAYEESKDQGSSGGYSVKSTNDAHVSTQK